MLRFITAYEDVVTYRIRELLSMIHIAKPKMRRWLSVHGNVTWE